MNEDVSASFIDKTDWRITLHRKLEACVDAEGTRYYKNRVKSLISAYSAHYPGWDAKTELDQFIKIKEIEYNNTLDEWLEENQSKGKWHKYHFEKHLEYMFHHEIFEHIKNNCAKKRMLLWGSKPIPGGTQMTYSE